MQMVGGVVSKEVSSFRTIREGLRQRGLRINHAAATIMTTTNAVSRYQARIILSPTFTIVFNSIGSFVGLAQHICNGAGPAPIWRPRHSADASPLIECCYFRPELITAARMLRSSREARLQDTCRVTKTMRASENLATAATPA